MVESTHGSTSAQPDGLLGDDTSAITDPTLFQEGTEPNIGDESGDYVYGFDSLFASARGPISPDELILWLKAHSEGLNQDLSDRMMGADMRAKLTEDLSYLKSQVHEGMGGDELRAEANRLLAAYAGTAYAADLEKALKGILENTRDIDGTDKNEADEVSATEADLINGELQTMIDKLGKDDQMDMVYIQSLSDRLNEQFGFASAYASKYHDTLMAIIGNMA